MNRRNTLSAIACAVAGPVAALTLPRAEAATAAAAAPRRVLWAANVRSKPLAERFDAARAGGFTHMSMFHRTGFTSVTRSISGSPIASAISRWKGHKRTRPGCALTPSGR